MVSLLSGNNIEKDIALLTQNNNSRLCIFDAFTLFKKSCLIELIHWSCNYNFSS